MPAFVMLQKQSPDVFCENDVLKNFAKFTGKNLYFIDQGLIFLLKKNKLQDLL